MFKKKSWVSSVITLILVVALSFFVSEKSKAKILSGIINEEYVISESGMIVDQNTGQPVEGATVSIPAKGIETKTNRFGKFQLDFPNSLPLILSVKADGYKPFSLIINENRPHKPMKIAIAEQSTNEIVIDTGLHHLGDDKFSRRSANCNDFSARASGTYFFKEFFVDQFDPQYDVALVIGSIIGIDTKKAQYMMQSAVKTASSSPVEVFFNSHKIGEISVNGNNHTLRVPPGLVRINSYNHVRIETGVNLASSSRKDYDDIEFIHLVLEFR